MRRLKLWAMLLIAASGLSQFTVDAVAKVTRIEVISTSPYGSFKPGEYVRWDFRVVGEISPTSEQITDVEKPSRNARGMVEYATRVTLIAPAESVRGSGTLLVDVPNRGRPISQSVYNSPRHSIIPLGSFDQGTGFLQDNGFSIAAIAWEQGYGVELPMFVGDDGKPRYIEGVGLAIVRDVADFFGTAAADASGVRNPIAGKVSRTIALGYSQTGRFLKSFLVRGFNVTDGRRVFSGMHILGAASGHIALRSIPGPNSGAGVTPNFTDPEVRGVNEEPLAIADIVEQTSKRGEAVPRLMFVNTTTDYFSIRSSLGRTGASGTQDKPLPENVRMYDMAGASHALIPGKGDCKYLYAVLDWHPIMRSTLVALNAWVSAGTPPPANVLMSLQTAAEGQMALKAPAHFPQSVTQVPKLDQDGNATGGVRLPDMAAPLGTHAAQNPPLSFLCSLAAAYIPFAKTKQERESTNDARMSLAERYKDRNEYVNHIRGAARRLEQQGFLLPEDAATIVYSAAEANVPK